MFILGISCFYHDAAACLLHDGQIASAAQEERFSRVKHDWRFPENAIQYCLRQAGITIHDLDLIVFYEKPFLKFERVLETYLSVAPRGLKAFLDTVPSWLRQKIRLPDIIKQDLGYHGKVLFTEHHMAHAASSFFLSPFEEAAILTIDGAGEWATASYGFGKGNKITLTHEMNFPNSLGLLYSAFTAYLGFEVNDAEYKVMGLAPYGEPVYRDIIVKNLMNAANDGSIRLNLEYFSFQYGRRMFSKKFKDLLGVPPRKPGSPILREHYNLAMSVQRVTEEVILRMAGHVQQETGMKNLCLAGGVTLNCVANGRVLREGPFDNIFIQPAAGDAGGAMGAAYLGWHHYLDKRERHPMSSAYLGPSFSNDEIRIFLSKNQIPFKEYTSEQIIRETARVLADGKVAGLFQGRMEFGPRALGNRSILADPRRPEMKDLVNRKIKFRESFRPFAPAVPLEDCPAYFDIDAESPYMLLAATVKDNRIPAVTHVDGSARVQTVKRQDNPLFYDILRKFQHITGIPVLLNTSLNLMGEPIACGPEDAYRCFTRSDMDCLVIGNFFLAKDNKLL